MLVYNAGYEISACLGVFMHAARAREFSPRERCLALVLMARNRCVSVPSNGVLVDAIHHVYLDNCLDSHEAAEAMFQRSRRAADLEVGR
jgi:hypothetical protein